MPKHLLRWRDNYYLKLNFAIKPNWMTHFTGFLFIYLTLDLIWAYSIIHRTHHTMYAMLSSIRNECWTTKFRIWFCICIWCNDSDWNNCKSFTVDTWCFCIIFGCHICWILLYYRAVSVSPIPLYLINIYTHFTVLSVFISFLRTFIILLFSHSFFDVLASLSDSLLCIHIKIIQINHIFRIQQQHSWAI